MIYKLAQQFCHAQCVQIYIQKDTASMVFQFNNNLILCFTCTAMQFLKLSLPLPNILSHYCDYNIWDRIIFFQFSHCSNRSDETAHCACPSKAAHCLMQFITCNASIASTQCVPPHPELCTEYQHKLSPQT